MEIVDGRYYKTRSGDKVGPMVQRESYGKCPWGLSSGPQRWHNDGRRYDGVSEPDTDLIAEWTEWTEWTDGPVRTVTRTVTEIVEGQYGRIRVCPHLPNAVLVGFTDGSGDWDYTSLTASELKAAAAVLLELAGALE